MPFTPEQADTTLTWKGLSARIWNIEPSADGISLAKGTHWRSAFTPTTVRLVNHGRKRRRRTWYGRGQARKRNPMARRWRHIVRTPNRMTTAPATKKGKVNRSIRQTQNMVERRLGKTRLTATARASRGTPRM